MKIFLLATLCNFFFVHLFAQNNCDSDHPLFTFHDRNPVVVTVLGKGKEFYPLHDLTTRQGFFDTLKNAALWKGHHKEKQLAEINILLKIIGFSNGVESPELTQARISDEKIAYDSEGNLGGTRKDKKGEPVIHYHFSKLHIYGFETSGVPAWKITGPTGCYFYVLKRCGNAYYEKEKKCCNAVEVSITSKPDTIKSASIIKKLYYMICTYKVIHHYKPNNRSKHEKGMSAKPDSCGSATMVLDKCKKDSIMITVPEGINTMIYLDTATNKFIVCSDTTIKIKGNLRLMAIADAASKIATPKYDTLKTYYDVIEPCQCDSNKFEIGLNGGFAYNTVPDITSRFTHTRASNAHFTGDFYASYLFSKNFQAGIDVSAVTLAYKDDASYPRTVASSALYSEVFLAKPAIPIQLFGKLSWAVNGLTSYVSLSAGYVISTNDQIRNSNVLLTPTPGTGNGFVAGFGLGADYFWNCHWGIGAGVKAEYISISGSAQQYKLFAYPVTAGLRYRFK